TTSGSSSFLPVELRGIAWGGAVAHAEKSSRPRPWDHGRRTGGPASVQKRRASAREERDTTRSSRFGGRRVPSAWRTGRASGAAMPPPARRAFSFPKSARLLRRGEFVRLRAGRGLAEGPLAASWLPRAAETTRGGMAPAVARVGLVVSSKVGGAVLRNRVKR